MACHAVRIAENISRNLAKHEECFRQNVWRTEVTKILEKKNTNER